MEDVQRLVNLAQWKRKQPDRTFRLGEVVSELVERRIEPLWASLGPVLEVWEEVLPEELARHCRIEGAAGGELKVSASSPAYAHELRMCAGQLVAELRRQCPRAKIRSIKVAVGQTPGTCEE